MTKKILFFDTETTWFIKNFTPIEKQPAVVQFGWIYWQYTFGEEWIKIEEEVAIDELFNPGKPIPPECTEVHGITDEMVKEKPSINEFMKWFVAICKDADLIVWHNIDFDRQIMFLEVDRVRKKDSPEKKERKKMFVEKQVCTMKGATEFCSIPSPRGWNKFPKLNELHSKLFGEEFDNAHNAFADIEATKKCFFELKKLSVL